MERGGDLIVCNASVDGMLSDVTVRNGIIESVVAHVSGTDAETSGTAAASDCRHADCVFLDAGGKMMLPAFANMHTHAAMTALRGVGEGLPLSEWLQAVWKIEAALTPEQIYWATRLACIEMVRTGTTVFNDQYWMPESSARAVADSGMRAHLTYVFLDMFDSAKAAVQLKECSRMLEISSEWSGNVDFGISVHSVYTVSAGLIRNAGEIARRNGKIVHVHVSETEKENADCIAAHGMTPTAYLDSLGLLENRTVAAHSLWLSKDDISVYGRRKTTAVHNVNSNLKLASGFRFMFRELLEAGAYVALGTDGCGSSNNLDMREACKTSVLMQNAWRGDAASVRVDEILKASSSAGFMALGMDAGRIAPGALADFMLVDTSGAAFVPGYDLRSDFIYSANSSCIDTVVCGGRILMEGGVIPGEKDVVGECRRVMGPLLKLS